MIVPADGIALGAIVIILGCLLWIRVRHRASL